MALTNTAGEAFARYTYDPYGTVLTQATNTVGAITAGLASAIGTRQPLRYAGYAYDAHSATYYLSQRHYDPATMRFLTKDPARDDGEESAYQYCAGDPVGKVDPSGEAATKLLSNAAYDRARARIKSRADYILRNATGYLLGGKSETGKIDCSGLVTRVMVHAGIFSNSAVNYWNSGRIYQEAPRKGVPSVAFFNKGNRMSYRIGDVLYKAGRPGHVAIVVSDGQDPWIVESSPRYGGPKKHRLSARWASWAPTGSGRFFIKQSAQLIR